VAVSFIGVGNQSTQKTIFHPFMLCCTTPYSTIFQLSRSYHFYWWREPGLPNNWYKPITNTAWVRARLCKLQKRVHSTRQVIKFTSCLSMVDGSLWVLRLLPPLKQVTVI